MRYRCCTVGVFAFSLLCLPGMVDAQFRKNIAEYYDYFNASIRAKHAGKTDSAIYYAREAIKADPNNNKPYRHLSDLLIKRGNYREAIALLQKGILSGDMPPEDSTYMFDNYDSVKGRPEVIAFLKKLPELKKEYYCHTYNHAFANMISRMMGYDQAVRGSIDKMKNTDSATWNRAMSIQLYLDTVVNLPELVAYLKTNDFPAYNSMDDKVSGDFHVIIHHIIAVSDGPQTGELHKLIQQAIYEGKYPAYSYMLALDWHSINRTGKQIYGTYIGAGTDGETTFAPAIDNVAIVDALRAKWKVGPLSEVALSDWRNPKLPVGYQP
jgi:tetratricopeptide (TPR) repeat protein